MDENTVLQYLTNSLDGIDITLDSDNYFVFYDPDKTGEDTHRFPIITLVTNDAYDTASDLNRPGVYRLNIGISKEPYVGLFGTPPPFPASGGVIQTGHDFTAQNQLLPHPIYAAMFWVCILNPSAEMFDTTVRPLLHEAQAQAAQRY